MTYIQDGYTVEITSRKSEFDICVTAPDGDVWRTYAQWDMNEAVAAAARTIEAMKQDFARKTHAQTEFLAFIGDRAVQCADITHRFKTERICQLRQHYTEAEYTAFLQSLDFRYDAGYGSQELYGTIWFTDGTWAIRGEYDGSEWWQLCNRPAIPQELI